MIGGVTTRTPYGGVFVVGGVVGDGVVERVGGAGDGVVERVGGAGDGVVGRVGGAVADCARRGVAVRAWIGGCVDAGRTFGCVPRGTGLGPVAVRAEPSAVTTGIIPVRGPELSPDRIGAPSVFIIASCAPLIPRNTSFESRCSSVESRPKRAG